MKCPDCKALEKRVEALEKGLFSKEILDSLRQTKDRVASLESIACEGCNRPATRIETVMHPLRGSRQACLCSVCFPNLYKDSLETIWQK